MSFKDTIVKWLFEDSIGDDNFLETSPIIDNNSRIANLASGLWQLNYAFDVVTNLLSIVLSNVEWRTYSKDGIVKGDEWYRFNYSMNNKETAVEFYCRLATKLIKDRKALIIETANNEFFIADSYSFKNGSELDLKPNTFINVRVGTTQFNRTFKENESCMYIKTPQNGREENIHNQMALDYIELKKLILEGADKALGMKLALDTKAQGKNLYDKDYLKKVQEAYEPLMQKRNAVFVTYNGQALTDLTERQRGSEVQQVLEAVDNNIKVNEEVLNNVGNSYGIPKKFMVGDFTADNDSIYEMFITLFAKPYLELLSKKFTTYCLNKEDIIQGAKISANLNSIKFVDNLKSASAVDKYIGSGAYTIDEVRDKVGDDPTDDGLGNIRFITKNYAVLKDYVKGGTGNEV